MKDIYVSSEIEIIKFDEEDVIATSNITPWIPIEPGEGD